MKMIPITPPATSSQIDQLLELELIKHDNYKELYQLIQLERNTRLRIDQLIIKLKLNKNASYNYSPVSPLETLISDLNIIKRKKDSTSETSKTENGADHNRPTPSP